MVIFTEKNGSYATQETYKLTWSDPGKKFDVNIKKSVNPSVKYQSSWVDGLWNRLKQTLLPHGYPDSVSDDYLPYQFWDTIQEVCYALGCALCSSAILKANLTQEGDSAGEIIAGMAIVTLLREACNKIGPIYFTMADFGSLDSQHKQWRLVADILTDISMFMDVLTPTISSFPIILLICCIASLIKGIASVIGSSTRAPLLQHLAKCNNAAHVIAKEECQRGCVKLICLLLACIILPKTAENTGFIIMAYTALAFLHIYANHRAQSTLKITSLNEGRLLICMQQFLTTGTIPSVKEANERESVFFGFGLKDSDVCGYKVKIGVSLASVMNEINSFNSSKQGEGKTHICEDDFNTFDGKCFIIIPNEARMEMNIILHETIYDESTQLFEGYTRAIFTAYQLTQHKSAKPMDTAVTAQINAFQATLQAQGFNNDNVALNLGHWLCSMGKSD